MRELIYVVVIGLVISTNVNAADCDAEQARELTQSALEAGIKAGQVTNLKLSGGTVHVVKAYKTEDYSVDVDQAITTINYTYEMNLPIKNPDGSPVILSMSGYSNYAGKNCILVSDLATSVGGL